MSVDASEGKAPQTASAHSRGYVRIALLLLTFTSVLNFLDRQVINILAESIKRDLGLSDTQLGMMTGLAFAVFYTVLGLPLARLADNPKTNRVTLISVCLVIWSAMTTLTGFAQSFPQMLLARIGVGIGEAGAAPPAHSLITDLVPRERQASAMALYGAGIPIGGLLGMMLGGLLADQYGWRAAFMVVGAPGVIFAIVLHYGLAEPRRALRGLLQAQAKTLASAPRISLAQAFTELGRSRTFVCLVVAGSIVSFLSYGKTVWQAVLFIRVFGLSPGQAGLWLGLTSGLAGALGMYLGGYFADRLGRTGSGRMLLPPAIGLALSAPLLLVGYLQEDWRASLVLLVLPIVAGSLFYGPTFSCAHRLVRPEMRSMASAITMFINTLVGIGLGPLSFGIMSDVLAPVAGVQSVRWVLASSALISLIPALFFWLASRQVDREVRS